MPSMLLAPQASTTGSKQSWRSFQRCWHPMAHGEIDVGHHALMQQQQIGHQTLGRAFALAEDDLAERILAHGLQLRHRATHRAPAA